MKAWLWHPWRRWPPPLAALLQGPISRYRLRLGLCIIILQITSIMSTSQNVLLCNFWLLLSWFPARQWSYIPTQQKHAFKKQYNVPGKLFIDVRERIALHSFMYLFIHIFIDSHPKLDDGAKNNKSPKWCHGNKMQCSNKKVGEWNGNKRSN